MNERPGASGSPENGSVNTLDRRTGRASRMNKGSDKPKRRLSEASLIDLRHNLPSISKRRNDCFRRTYQDLCRESLAFARFNCHDFLESLSISFSYPPRAASGSHRPQGPAGRSRCRPRYLSRCLSRGDRPGVPGRHVAGAPGRAGARLRGLLMTFTRWGELRGSRRF